MITFVSCHLLSPAVAFCHLLVSRMMITFTFSLDNIGPVDWGLTNFLEVIELPGKLICEYSVSLTCHLHYFHVLISLLPSAHLS